MVLAILAGYDHVMHNGKYAAAAMQASNSILHHFGV
jgi:hypothetical protein